MGTDFKNDPAELSAMRHVPLREFAVSRGWIADLFDKNKMRRNGQTIVLGTAQKLHTPDGTTSFWLCGGDDQQRGGIINFVEFVEFPGMTLGDVRRILRPWIGRSEVIAPLVNPVPCARGSEPETDRTLLDDLHASLTKAIADRRAA